MEKLHHLDFEKKLTQYKIIPPFLLPGPQWALVISLVCILIVISFYNYLLFHTLIELIAIMIASFLSVVVWQTFPASQNRFLMFLGVGYIWIAVLDLLHVLVYKGMVIFPVLEANPATQFWISARYLEAFVLLIAPLFLTYSLKRDRITYLFATATIVICIMIMSGNFPDAFIEGKGLTPFKVFSEYLIMAVLVGAIVHLWSKHDQIDPYILILMTASIFLTICAEFIFTFYKDVYGYLNLTGHIFKLVSYWFIYEAIVRTTLKEPFRVLTQELYDEIRERKILEKKLKFQASHDHLTGLYNRSIFQQRITDEMNRATRYQHSLSIFMLDIDHFKKVNDIYGHQVGDNVLRSIASLLKNAIRDSDTVIRYGGEEFIVILPETSITKAKELAERLITKVSEKFVSIDDRLLNLTVSIGIATYPDNAKSWQDLVEAADQAMYSAKKSGRNQAKTAVMQ
ncbi:MAG: GGDEF domain-containing protein [Pseudomonadota bacterium]